MGDTPGYCRAHTVASPALPAGTEQTFGKPAAYQSPGSKR